MVGSGTGCDQTAMPDEESDVSFANFGLGDGSKRHPRGTKARAVTQTKMPPRRSDRGRYLNLERETGIEPATLSLGNRPDPKK